MNALEICHTHKMTLVGFDSRTEAEHFNKVAGKRVWVGVNDSENEGIFVRVSDGKPVDIPWDFGEPNNGRGLYWREHCVESIPGQKFNDICCIIELNFACEKIEVILGAPNGAVDLNELW